MTSTLMGPRTGLTQNANIRLDICTCAACGTAFGIEANLHSKLMEKGRNFYCPNGHVLHYGNSELEQTKTMLAVTQKQLAMTEHQRQVTKGALTRLTHRIAFGVCPCCHRHFDDVQRHMATKHPDFLKTQDSTGESADFTSLEKLLAQAPGDLMSVEDAARFKGVTEQTVRYAIHRRRLPAVILKGRFRLARPDVEKWRVRGYTKQWR